MPLLNSCAQLISAELEAHLQGRLQSTRTTSSWRQKYLQLISIIEIYGHVHSVTRTQKHLRHLSASEIREMLRAVPSYMPSKFKKDAAKYLCIHDMANELFAYRLRHNLLHGWPYKVPYVFTDYMSTPQSPSEDELRKQTLISVDELRKLQSALSKEQIDFIVEARFPVKMFSTKTVRSVKRFSAPRLAKFINAECDTEISHKALMNYCRQTMPEFAYRERLRQEQCALLRLEALEAKLN